MSQTNEDIKTILLVDDDEDEFEIFQLAASKTQLPFNLFHVESCDKEKLKALPKPDLIFLDINMPEHDGFMWLKGIREKLAEPIPIIMYSTTSNEENVKKAYDLGANYFITKPSDTATLSKAVKWVLLHDWTNPVASNGDYEKTKFYLRF